jgi:hypothetical protein
LEWADVSRTVWTTLAEFFFSKAETEGQSQALNLDELQADCEEKSYAQEEDGSLWSPDNRSNEADSLLKDFHVLLCLVFVFFSPFDFFLNRFVENNEIVDDKANRNKTKPERISLG